MVDQNIVQALRDAAHRQDQIWTSPETVVHIRLSAVTTASWDCDSDDPDADVMKAKDRTLHVFVNGEREPHRLTPKAGKSFLTEWHAWSNPRGDD